MSQDQFIEELISRYPKGYEKLETEIQSLKRKLDDVEFSDINEEEYCKLADSVENKIKKQCSATEADFSSATEADFKCSICSKTFSRRSNLNRHVIGHSSTYKCGLCNKRFRRQDYLQNHQKKIHKENLKANVSCRHCHENFDTYPDLFQHVSKKHPLNSIQNGGRKPLADKSQKQLQDDIIVPEARNENAHQQQRQQPQHHHQQQGALQNAVLDRTILPRNEEKYDLLTFFSNIRNEITDFLISRLKQHGIKWHLSAS